jgi:signal transduction histidine kinase
MRSARTTAWIVAAWALLVGTYAVAALVARPSPQLTKFGDIMQCLVPLFANAGLLLNAGSPNWRRNAFWMLLALGCTLWMIGQLEWTYFEIYLNRPVPNPFAGDVIIFLHVMPMIGALALLPHAKEPDGNFRFGRLDFVLLLLWWVYLYLFIVIPWQYVRPDPSVYLRSYIELSTLENLVLLGGLGVLCLRTRGRWRVVYAHLFGAAALYAFASQTANVAIAQNKYYTGSVYDLPLVASFVWFGTAGILARQLCPEAEPVVDSPEAEEARSVAARPQAPGVWPARLAMAAVLSMPLLALWSVALSHAPDEVRHFRLNVTLIAILPLSFLVFLRQHLLDADRLRLLRASQESLESLRRLQSQMVQTEKLASLGQLAAGAAHEINNPLTAILGYSELLVDDPATGERPRNIAEKIRDQARRTKVLVNHLLSFARRVPAARTLLDVNAVVTSAVQLRGLDLRGKNIHIELQTESGLPTVRGDANQLVQVFFNIISNAVEAMEEVGGGVLMVKTFRERAAVVIQFTDAGPGIKDPALVFDPFYTTKPVGKGTGLGLSICYGLVQEHGGHISCANRPEGGATFRIELPAVLAALPVRELAGASPGVTSKTSS